jgi:hypothetical protein
VLWITALIAERKRKIPFSILPLSKQIPLRIFE